MAEQRDNSGVLFHNEELKTEKSPTHSGKAMIGGVEYRIAGWVNEGESGEFLGLKFTRADEDRGRPRQSGGSSGSTRRGSSF